jgi:hypothetical protein
MVCQKTIDHMFVVELYWAHLGTSQKEASRENARSSKCLDRLLLLSVKIPDGSF